MAGFIDNFSQKNPNLGKILRVVSKKGRVRKWQNKKKHDDERDVTNGKNRQYKQGI